MKEPLHGARFLMAETAQERLPASEAEVVVVGRSNVGKSSLLCALTNNWKLARVSKTPGATREIHIYEIKPGRWLVDLPGYGYAVGPARERNYWPEMIGRYLLERPSLKCAYVLIDSEIGAGKIDVLLIQWLNEKKIPYQIVATKTDKIGRQKHASQRLKISSDLGVEPESIFWVAAKDDQGIIPLQQDIIRELELP
jgi:GTP-binding protein